MQNRKKCMNTIISCDGNGHKRSPSNDSFSHSFHFADKQRSKEGDESERKWYCAFHFILFLFFLIFTIDAL